ncbi:hypothetical protein VNO77_23441 [Canavalia gladiata]|uniref:Uncharacterized protein n=1 Tax=Canavalia gladiata TaxID=3824 RepID=A0AAN9QBI2_CANGL
MKVLELGPIRLVLWTRHCSQLEKLQAKHSEEKANHEANFIRILVAPPQTRRSRACQSSLYPVLLWNVTIGIGTQYLHYWHNERLGNNSWFLDDQVQAYQDLLVGRPEYSYNLLSGSSRGSWSGFHHQQMKCVSVWANL